jgi:hypothetical protein
VENVNKIIGPALIGRNPVEQKEIDTFMVETLDGTRNEWGSVSVFLIAALNWCCDACACDAQLVQAEAWRQRHPGRVSCVVSCWSGRCWCDCLFIHAARV